MRSESSAMSDRESSDKRETMVRNGALEGVTVPVGPENHPTVDFATIDGSIPGATVGPYEIIREIGRGGQANVYLAHDRRLNRRVALKVLREPRASDSTIFLRFKREAEITSRLEHPGICPIYDAGAADGNAWIAMRWIDGRTLSQRLQAARVGGKAPSSEFKSLTSTIRTNDAARRDPESDSGSTKVPPTPTADWNISDALTVIEKVARAAHAAHEAGVIHRDLKPGNIMLDKDDEPTLLDFGLARFDDGDAEHLTLSSERLGTPSYMSPEQLTGPVSRLDRRTDVYSLGVTLYECTTLRRPFEAATREALYQSIQTDEPSDPRRLNGRISGDLSTVILTAMAKDRDRRYQTALDFADDIRAVRRGAPIRARRIGPIGRSLRWAKRRPAQAALICVTALAVPILAGLSGWIIAHKDDVDAQRIEKTRRDVERALERGYLALGELNRRNSHAAFLEALAIDRDCAEAIAGRAMIEMSLGRFADAAAILRERADLLAKTPGLARLLDEALRADAPIPATNPTTTPVAHDALTHFLLGRIAVERGIAGGGPADFHDGLAHLRQAALLTGRPRAVIYYEMARAARGISDRRTSEDIARLLTDLWPESSVTWFYAGLALHTVDPEAAIAHLSRSIAIDPLMTSASMNLANLYLESGRPDESLRVLENAAKADPQNVRYPAQIASMMFGRRPHDEVVAQCQKALAIDPNDSVALSFLALVQVETGKLREGFETSRKAISGPFTPANCFANHGVVAVRNGRLDEAIAAFRQSVRRDSENKGRLGNLAIALHGAGSYKDALVVYEEVLKYVRRSPSLRARYGRCLHDIGRIDEGLAAHEAAAASFRQGDEWDGPASIWRAESVDAVRIAPMTDEILKSESVPSAFAAEIAIRVARSRGKDAEAWRFFDKNRTRIESEGGVSYVRAGIEAVRAALASMNAASDPAGRKECEDAAVRMMRTIFSAVDEAVEDERVGEADLVDSFLLARWSPEAEVCRKALRGEETALTRVDDWRTIFQVLDRRARVVP